MPAIKTYDLFRTAYLLCHGGQLETTHIIRNQVLFVIQGETVNKEDQRYRTGQALVNPLQYREAINMLRDVIYENLKMNKKRNPHVQSRANRGGQTGQ